MTSNGVRYLGIDYGTKQVGLALSDENGMFAFPHTTVPNDKHLMAYLSAILEERQIGAVVIGDTRTIGGLSNRITAEAEQFAKRFEKETSIVPILQNEGFTSMEASRFAPKGRERDDAASAAIILQRYLDVHKAS